MTTNETIGPYVLRSPLHPSYEIDQGAQRSKGVRLSSSLRRLAYKESLDETLFDTEP